MIGHKRIPSREGGVEVVVDELATRLAAQGYQVEAYNRSGYHVSGKDFDGGRKKYYKGVRIIITPTFENGKLNAIVYSVLATLRALFGRYDVIHYHAEGPCVTLLAPKLLGVKVVATIHGLDWQRAKWGNFASRVLKLGEKMAAKYADEVIVLSKNLQEYFLTVYGRETHYIPNGVSRSDICRAQEIREKYGLEKDGYLLFLARLVPEKGLHYLIEAYRTIHTDKKLVIAGGSSHSFDYMKQIQEMTASDERIIMTNFVQGRVLEELYSNAYLFVLPSDVEGMALTLLEAMSYGNCCLVSDIPENLEVVEDKAAAFKKGSVEDLRKKLVYLLEHPEAAADYKEKSADFICSKYNWGDMVERTKVLYENINRK
ncbi:MAG: glycosyltransferase family 4 protein [Clostridium sp.]|nr:glycosyltransferase family 4 protein [Clostridium sp.]